MTIEVRKLTMVGAVAATIVLANVWGIAGWLERLGLVAWAQSVRAEYVTGTAITVIAVLLILRPPAARTDSPLQQSACTCPVCNEGLRPQGRYCPACGSVVR